MGKTFLALAVAMLMVGCGSKGVGAPAEEKAGGPDASSKPGSTGATSTDGVSGKIGGSGVSDSEFRLPIYAGATPVELTGVETNVGKTKTFTKAWNSTDSVQQVSDFYKAEAPKAGKVLLSESAGNGNSMITTIVVNFTGGGQCQIFVSHDKSKGSTLFSMTQAEEKK